MFDVLFDNLSYGHLFWLVALLIGVMIFTRFSQRVAMKRFADSESLKRLMPGLSPLRHWFKVSMLAMGLICLTLAAMDPRWGRQWKEVSTKGVDVMFVLDVSRSMLAEDVTPSRLRRAKQLIRDTMSVMDGDRVGLVVFAGDARLEIPLTSSYADVNEELDLVTPFSSKRGGSVLGNAINKGVESFPEKLTDHKAMIIISDGEDQESEPVTAARQAYQEHGIRVYTVGLGDETTGAEIPIPGRGGRVDYVTQNGERVITKMNGETLSKVAENGGGIYLPAGTRRVDMAEVYQKLVSSVPGEGSHQTRVRAYQPRYMWFVGLALLCLAAEMLISTATRRRFTKKSPMVGGEQLA